MIVGILAYILEVIPRNRLEQPDILLSAAAESNKGIKAITTAENVQNIVDVNDR